MGLNLFKKYFNNNEYETYSFFPFLYKHLKSVTLSVTTPPKLTERVVFGHNHQKLVVVFFVNEIIAHFC